MIRDDEKYQNDVQLSIQRIKTDFHSKTNNHDGDPKSVFRPKAVFRPKHLDQIIWTVLLITEVPKDHEYKRLCYSDVYKMYHSVLITNLKRDNVWPRK